jgi:putative ABC transport system permease protein
MRALWIRWVLRDLRHRWLLVTAIALVLALGTGTYAALSSTSEWRTRSNDASFALLGMHDLKLTLTPGAYVPRGTLRGLVEDSASAAVVAGMAERLVVPTQVSVQSPGGEVLVPGRVVGADPSDIDTVDIAFGRALDPADAVPTAVLEQKFAAAYDLPSSGDLRLRGEVEVGYVGLGVGPEEFVIDTGGIGLFGADSGFAVVYTTLDGAQAVASAPGVVNDLVLALEPDADRSAVVNDLAESLASAQPPISATVTTRDDVLAYQVLYDDIEGDQRFWTVISALMIAGATLAAVNLISRVMDGQRREIGIGMALGTPARRLAIRPFAVAGAIALLGVVLGLLVAAALSVPLRGVYSGLLPLPVWHTPFVIEPFLVAAAIGVVVPLLATALPVRRALRVQPVDAIRVGHLAATGSGLSTAALHIPGRSVAQMPVRNVLRTPRRTLLTALGIAAAVGLMVGLGGMLDSLHATLDIGERESVGGAPDRLMVSLDGVYSRSDPSLAQIAAAPGVASVAPALRVPTTAEGPGGSVELVVEVLDPQTAPWRPTVSTGEATGGLLLTELAASDLGVVPGDTVQLEHPVVTAQGLQPGSSEVVVAGTHPYPLRPIAFLDPDSATILGPSSVATTVTVMPERSADLADLRRAVAAVPGVSAVTTPTDLVDQMSDPLDMLTGVLGVIAVVTLVLALLIAINAASITAEERRREHATMLAFGLSHRFVLGLSMAEGAVIGALGTAIGTALGVLLTRLMVYGQLPQTLPEVAMTATVSPGTIVLAVAVGTAAVALAPLVTARRLARMDVPGTLRLVE